MSRKGVRYRHMGNFQNSGDRRGGFSGGRSGGSRGGFSGGRGGDRGGDRRGGFGGDREVTMHKATCADCGKECEVPFKPSGDKPVFCSDCFRNKRDDSDRGGDRGERRDFGSREPRREFNSRPERSSFSRPAPSNEDTKKQFAELNTKIDRLIGVVEKLLEGKTGAKSEAKVEDKKEVEKPLVVTKAAKKTTLKSVVKKALKK